jgi:hypothetical protein
MPIQRNIAHDVPFVMINNTTGGGLTGASVTGYRILDGGIQEAVSGSIVEKGNGQYLFEGTEDDFNAEFTSGLLFTASGGIPVHVLMQMVFFERNTAYDIPFVLLNSSLGTALTGASPSGYRVLDGAAQESVSGTFVERGNGQYVFQATAEDFGAQDIIGFLITASGAVPLHLTIDLKERFVATQILSDNPAAIIRQHLILQSLVTDPDSGSNWPAYIQSLPDGDNVEDNALTIYNTTPLLDGRLMIGPVIQHYGIQIMVRATTYEAGWDKCSAIDAELSSVHNESVVVGSVTYQIVNVSPATAVISMGAEPGTKRREKFSMNYLITMKQSS